MVEKGRIPGTIDLGVTEALGLPSVPRWQEAVKDLAPDIDIDVPGIQDLIENLGLPSLYELQDRLQNDLNERIKKMVATTSNDKARNRRDLATLEALVVAQGVTLMGASLYLANSQDFIVELSRSLAAFMEPLIPTTDEVTEAVGGVAGGKIR